MKGRVTAVLAATTLLALGLRLAGLGLESIWFDEAYSLRLADAGVLDLLTGRVADPGNPCGYFVLLRLWLDVFGFSIESARALSAVTGAAAVPAVWLLATKLGWSNGARSLAAFLVAVDPPLVYLGREARAFALFATVATLAAAAAATIVRTRRWTAWAAFVALGSLLIHLHYYGFFVLVSLGCYLLAWGWRCHPPSLWRLVVAAGLIGLTFVPWLPIFRWQLSLGSARSEQTWWQHLFLLPLFSIAGRTLVWKEQGQAVVALVDLLVVAGVCVPLIFFLARARTWPLLPLAFSLGVPAVAAAVSLLLSPMVHTHYLSVILPSLLLVIAVGLSAGRQLRSRLLIVPVLLLGVLMTGSLVRLYAVRHKTDWRAIAQFIRATAPAAPAYFYEDIGEDPYRYYAPAQERCRIVQPFGADGQAWRTSGVLADFDKNKDGFWLVLYLTLPPIKAEEPAIMRLVNERFSVTAQTAVPQIRALLLKSRGGTVSAKSTNQSRPAAR